MTISPDVLPEGIDVEPGWIAYRYDDCSRILRDAKTFTSTGVRHHHRHGHGPHDPGHGRPRAPRRTATWWPTPSGRSRWRAGSPSSSVPIIDELIDRFVADGEADLVRQLTFEFPVRVIARLLGLPEEDFPQFQRWSVELIGLVADIDRGLAASESLREYFAGVVAERRARPAEDVISDLVSAEVDGEKLSDEAIYSFLRLLLPAGAETTYRSSGNLLYLLLTHPDQLEAVRADRSLLPQAIEEGAALRAAAADHQPDHHLRGGARRGDDRPRGEHHAAHRLGQPRRDTLGRPRGLRHLPPPIPHIAFAHGPHMCLGMHLARLETRALLNRVLDRLPDLALDPGDTDPHIRGDVFRSPTALPVTFAPGSVTRRGCRPSQDHS